jgi:hypothetical protein
MRSGTASLSDYRFILRGDAVDVELLLPAAAPRSRTPRKFMRDGTGIPRAPGARAYVPCHRRHPRSRGSRPSHRPRDTSAPVARLHRTAASQRRSHGHFTRGPCWSGRPASRPGRTCGYGSPSCTAWIRRSRRIPLPASSRPRPPGKGCGGRTPGRREQRGRVVG